MARKSALKLRDYGVPDLESLLKLARQKSKAGRRRIFTTVKDLFFKGGSELSDRERAIMGDILRQLVRDVERQVRKDLSERLAKRDDAPHELIVTLANDEIEVAHPILVSSTVLQNHDLIEIVRHRTQAHQLAVARRRSVPQKVSRAIVETHDEDVITALLKNGDAEISRGLMEYLVAESKRVDTFQNPLVDRHDLPPDLARRMYWWVSAAVRQHIVENFQVDATVIDDHIEESVNEALERDNLTKSERDPTEAQKLAAQMAERGEIDEEFLVNTLRQGEITLFEACFAETTGLRITLMRRLLYEPGGEGLAVACKAAGFGRATYTTIFQLTREVTSHAGAYDPREVNRVAEFFNRLEADHASDVIKRWKRDADYLHALSQIEESS